MEWHNTVGGITQDHRPVTVGPAGGANRCKVAMGVVCELVGQIGNQGGKVGEILIEEAGNRPT